MPDHTPIHREAAVDAKTRALGIQRLREIQTRKATEEAKKKELDQKKFQKESGWTN